MLEVSNIKVHVAPLRKHPAKESKVGFDALLRALRVSADEVASYELHMQQSISSLLRQMLLRFPKRSNLLPQRIVLLL